MNRPEPAPGLYDLEAKEPANGDVTLRIVEPGYSPLDRRGRQHSSSWATRRSFERAVLALSLAFFAAAVMLAFGWLFGWL